MSLHTGHRLRLDVNTSSERTRLFSRSHAAKHLMTVALVANDAVAVCAAFSFAYLVRFKTEWSIFYSHTNEPLDFYSSLVFWLAPLIIAVFALYQLYAPTQVFDGPKEYQRIISAATLSALLIMLISFMFDDGLVISRGWLLLMWISLILFAGGSRFVFRRAVYSMRRRGLFNNRVAVVASGPDMQELIDHLDYPEATGLDIVARIDPADMGDAAIANRSESYLKTLIQEYDLDDVIVSSASVPQTVLASIVRDISQMRTALHIIPGMFEIQTTGVQTRDVRGIPLVTLNKVRITGFDFLLKRSLDYLVAGSVLLILSPILLVVALLVRTTSPGPIFHRRKVLGERGRRFDALKFRTMYVNGDELLAAMPDLAEQLQRHGKLKDDPRVTPIGKWLRRWSLDEFPQLLNVLRGQMSLVGPRMITESELDRFGHWQENLITVKPGVTGLWQVSGRSNLGYDDRVRLDMFYIRSYSIWRDVEILIRTLPAVWRGTGAY